MEGVNYCSFRRRRSDKVNAGTEKISKVDLREQKEKKE